MITLSKTNYLVWRDCKKNAWLKVHRPDIYNISELSEFEKAIIETGNEVEREARKLFSDKVQYQPEFEKNGFFCAVDFLEYDPVNEAYNIYEVKASNETKESVHLHDLAFQYILLKDCGLKIRSANLMHLNKDYVRQGELDINKLFVSDDLTETIKEMEEETRAEMTMALKYISHEAEPGGNCDCLYKGRSGHCTTFHYSNPEVPDYSIHDIARIGLSKAKLHELINSEIYHIKDIPERIKLSEIQQNQVDAHTLDRMLVDKMRISEELDALSFPLYFLDYETYPCAIPRFDGFSPYQQIPFQFSLHILRGPTPGSSSGGRTPALEHFEYLHIENSDPSQAFAEHLKKYIGGVGSVIVWNKKFESKINEQLGDRQLNFQGFLQDINHRMYDLMDIFSKQYYVHKDFKGSTSIKYVLPVLAPELSYKDLNIQEGGTASQAWDKITSNGFTPAEKAQISHDLKEYCKLDTYAMYAIWNQLHQLK